MKVIARRTPYEDLVHTLHPAVGLASSCMIDESRFITNKGGIHTEVSIQFMCIKSVSMLCEVASDIETLAKAKSARISHILPADPRCVIYKLASILCWGG